MTGAAPGGGAQRAAVQRLFTGPEAFPTDIEQKATYLQWAGVKLFIYVFWFTVAVTGALFLYWILKTPSLPSPPTNSSPLDSAYLRVIIEQRTQVFNNFLEAVSRVLLNLCLPLLTGILGYIFGQKAEETKH